MSREGEAMSAGGACPKRLGFCCLVAVATVACVDPSATSVDGPGPSETAYGDLVRDAIADGAAVVHARIAEQVFGCDAASVCRQTNSSLFAQPNAHAKNHRRLVRTSPPPNWKCPPRGRLGWPQVMSPR